MLWQKRAIQNMSDMLEKKLSHLINLVQNSDTPCETTKNEMSLLPSFPLSSAEDLLKFEQELQSDRQIRKQFRNSIAKIGGKTYIHKTRNILKTILEDTVCKRLSWTGHKIYADKRLGICQYYNRLCLNCGSSYLK